MIVSTAARDIGGGAYQLDFENAAVARLYEGWVCPVTRRVFGYSPAGLSPYDPDRELKAIDLPRLPTANPGGLNPDARAEMTRWCENDSRIAEPRREGLWTELHDRAAVYAPFLRTQEHSAQIERPVLTHYEQLFKEGRINLLNCSTTMEMGVDIPDIQLIANANAPPSVSNYRQRGGGGGSCRKAWRALCLWHDILQESSAGPDHFRGSGKVLDGTRNGSRCEIGQPGSRGTPCSRCNARCFPAGTT